MIQALRKILLTCLFLSLVLTLQSCSGKKWALPNSSGQTGAGAAQKSWYEECIRRQAITISSAMTASDQSEFPVLIRITDQANPMFSRTQPDGDDIYFTEDDGITKLDHEIEYFMNTGTKELVAWVRIPLLSSTVDTLIYMHYGDSDIPNQENPDGTWNSDYGIVYHMDPQGIDSSGNGRNRVADLGSPVPDNTFLGFGMGFDGDDAWDQTDIAYWELGWDIRSHEVVFKTGSDVTSRQPIFAEGGGANGVMLYILGGELYARWWSESWGWTGDYHSTAVLADTTYHVIMSFYFDSTLNPLITNDVYELFVNGVSIDSTETPVIMSEHGGDGGVAYTGTSAKDFHDCFSCWNPSDPLGFFYFTGSIYEFRVSDAVTDIDYAAATYENQRDPQSYLSLGAEEQINCLGTWLFRQQITISAAMVPSDQADFPALIKITNQNNPVFDKARQSGADILFTMPDGMTKLAHELEYYKNTTTKELDAWVRIPSLSSVSDTIIYMYYGNPVSGNQESVDLVWVDADYAGVWHLSEPAGNHVDSTPNGNNGTPMNGVTQNAAGQIDGADDFDGIDGRINMGDALDIGINDFTFSAWIKTSAATSGRIVSKDDGSVGYKVWMIGSNGNIWLQFNDGVIGGFSSGSIVVNDDNWHHVVGVFDRDAIGEIYVDGVYDAGSDDIFAAAGSLSNGVDFTIGSNQGIGNFFDGSIDEVRISNCVRSADWILTEYNNQNNPAGFLNFSGEEVY